MANYNPVRLTGNLDALIPLSLQVPTIIVTQIGSTVSVGGTVSGGIILGASGATFSGDIEVTGNLTVDQNLFIIGGTSGNIFFSTEGNVNTPSSIINWPHQNSNTWLTAGQNGVAGLYSSDDNSSTPLVIGIGGLIGATTFAGFTASGLTATQIYSITFPGQGSGPGDYGSLQKPGSSVKAVLSGSLTPVLITGATGSVIVSFGNNVLNVYSTTAGVTAGSNWVLTLEGVSAGLGNGINWTSTFVNELVGNTGTILDILVSDSPNLLVDQALTFSVASTPANNMSPWMLQLFYYPPIPYI